MALTDCFAIISGLLSVTCTTCYVKGNAFASLVVDDDFNVTSAFEGFVEAFGSELKNLTVEVWDQFKEWAEEVAENVTDTVGQDFVNAFQGDCKSISREFPRDHHLFQAGNSKSNKRFL